MQRSLLLGLFGCYGCIVARSVALLLPVGAAQHRALCAGCTGLSRCGGSKGLGSGAQGAGRLACASAQVQPAALVGVVVAAQGLVHAKPRLACCWRSCQAA
jgi:hypothetical protein